MVGAGHIVFACLDRDPGFHPNHCQEGTKGLVGPPSFGICEERKPLCKPHPRGLGSPLPPHVAHSPISCVQLQMQGDVNSLVLIHSVLSERTELPVGSHEATGQTVS